MLISKQQLKEDKYNAYQSLINKLSNAYALDGDTDFISNATEIANKFKENNRIYSFLYRNKKEILKDSKTFGRQYLNYLEYRD